MSRLARWEPLLLFGLVAAVYATSVANAFVYDDHEVILQQHPVRSVADLARIFAEPHGLPLSGLPYYRPTTRSTLLLQKALHEGPAGFHLVNALLMGAVALAARALLRSPRLGLSAPAAAVGAALFALHPIASSVAYPIASGRETLLPALFVVAGVAAWLRGGVPGRWGATLCVALALFGKAQAIAAPLLLLLADALGLPPDAPGRALGRWARRHAPVFAVTLGYLLARGAAVPPEPGSEGGIAELLVLIRTQLAQDPFGPVASLGYLLQTFFAPFAGLRYEPSLPAWLAPGRMLLACGAFALLLAGASRLPARDRAPAAFWLLWVPLGMALTLNLWPQEARFAERFVFLSTLGLVALGVTVADRLAAASGCGRRLTVIGLACAAVLGALSLHRGVYYRDDVAFAAQWASTDPTHANARYSLGSALAERGRDADAIRELREAIRLEPRLAAAHYNLGVLLARRTRDAEAMASLRTTLAIQPRDASAHVVLAALLERGGRRGEAAAHYRAALGIEPGRSDAAAGLRRTEPRP